MKNNLKFREEWLHEAAQAIRPRIEEITGKMMPPFRISAGFPSRGALAVKKRVHGQCFPKHMSGDGMFETFISPLIHDPLEVAGVVAHELIHCNDENKSGHRGPFVRTAYAIGLKGKPTATEPGEGFIKFIDPILKKLGPYPHGGMFAKGGDLFKPVGSRLLKVKCPDCGYVVRVTAKWLAEMGMPVCQCKVIMHDVTCTCGALDKLTKMELSKAHQ